MHAEPRSWLLAILAPLALYACAAEESVGSPTPRETSTPRSVQLPPRVQVDEPIAAPIGFAEVASEVPHWELSYDVEHQATLDDLARGGEYVPGRLKSETFEGVVSLRHRGDGSRYHPKKSWKIDFPSGIEHEGRKKLNLMAEWLDRGIFTDKFNYDLMAAAGVPTPRARYVTLSINGGAKELFVEVEQVDKRFLRARGIDDDASIYRAGSNDGELYSGPKASWQWPWEKKTNEEVSSEEIYELERLVTETGEPSIARVLADQLELDLYLRYMAVCMLIGYQGIDQAGNYFLKRAGERWLMIPWDLNNATDLFFRLDTPEQAPYATRWIEQSTAYDPYLARQYENGVRRVGETYHNVWSVLDTRIWDRPELLRRVLAYVELYLDTIFSEETAFAHVDRLWSLAGPHVEVDPYTEPGDAARAPAFLKAWITQRRVFLRTQLESARSHGAGALQIAELAPAGGLRVDEAGEADPYVLLENTSDAPVSLGGKTVTTYLRDPFRFALAEGLVVPPKGALVLWLDGQPEQGAAHLSLQFAEGAGEFGLYDGVNRHGVLDLQFFPALPAGSAMQRAVDEPERFERVDERESLHRRL